LLHVVQHLLSEQVSLVPALVIFDKGGPLLDFRASSEAGLTALGVRSFVDALVCVDD
jgi:hypothetical protein